MSARAVAVALVLGIALVGRPLAAQERNHLYDKYQASVSAATLVLGTTVRIDPDSGEGTEVDVEDDLGIDKAGVRPRIGFRWRPSRKHELEAFYIFINRTGERTLNRDVTVDSVTYNAGASLGSKVGSDQFGVNWRWALHASEQSQLGVSVGLGATLFRFQFTGAAEIASDNGTVADTVTVEKKLPGPVLALGGFGRWRLSERWYVEADLRGLYVPIDNIKIGIVDGGGAVRYWPLDWLGTELGYSLTTQKVTIKAKDGGIDLGLDAGKIKYNTQNVRLGVIAAF